MKIIAVFIVSLSFLITATQAIGRTPSYSRLSVFNQQNPAANVSPSLIKGIQVFGESSGIAYTSQALYRTDDNGENWIEMPLPQYYQVRIAHVWFSNENVGIALFADQSASRLVRYDTSDGGITWVLVSMNDEQADLQADLTNADLDSAKMYTSVDGTEYLLFGLTTSSNFYHTVNYVRKPDELTWSSRYIHTKDTKYQERFASLKDDWGQGVRDLSHRLRYGDLPTDPVIAREIDDPHTGYRVHSNWYLTQNGSCSGFKIGCVLTTKLYKDNSSTDANRVDTISFKEITPPSITTLNKAEKEAAKSEAAKTQMFALPPGGSTRISLNRGFDKCTAAPASQMQLWWDNSYFQDANIYISGRNRGCTQAQLTAAWVNQVSAMGWGLIPTIVGYQSPCSVCTTCQKHSSDAATAETQGRGEADIAITDANNLGLITGTVLYYDMERYDETTATPGCRTSSTAFLKGWTERVKELGYISGVYGSPRNAIDDWQFMPPASRMDAVWMARWDNVLSVWTYLSFATFPTNIWNNHQRIKQWQAPHNETWGGVTFNIDGNIADGPVAGVQIPKNKVADFDGDGKTDVSVFRPSTGQWFISGTLGPTFSIYEFGVTTDILAPGDFDGDGKTDFAVFRPSDTTWYFRTKGGTFSARQFGATGDIPAAADYNGDGKTDIAIFRPSTGLWYISYSDSLNSFATVPFGENGDKPVVADYDGDGKSDIAVWRPSNGTWYVQGSAGNYFTAIWGIATDLPAQADYDGDGKADFAVFRGGTWYLLRANNEISVQQFGVEGDVPATGDFDGDGRYDIAIFRPSNGTWHMSQSQNGYSVREFGVLNDKPITNAYLPQ